MVDRTFLEWDKAVMFVSLQQRDVRKINAVLTDAVRTLPLKANIALLLGLLIILTTSGVVLIA